MAPTHAQSEAYAYSGEFGNIRKDILTTFLEHTNDAYSSCLKHKKMETKAKMMALFFIQLWEEGLAYDIPVQLKDWEIYSVTARPELQLLRTCWRVPKEHVGKFPDLPKRRIPDIDEFDHKQFRTALQDVLYVDENGDSFLNLLVSASRIPDQYQEALHMLPDIQKHILNFKESE